MKIESTFRACRRSLSHLPKVNSCGRRYSVTFEPRVTKIDIPVGGSGYTSINIHNAPPQGGPTTGPVILAVMRSDQEPLPRALLTPDATLVTIVPRWSSAQRFPQPLYDIVAAYEYITMFITQTNSGKSVTTPDMHEFTRLGMYSSSILGGTALCLALTQSLISAAAIKDGIYDHSILATETAPEKTDQSLSDYFSSGTKSLFTSPAQTFDPFVSPKMWFQNPGIRIPRYWPGEEPLLTPKTTMPVFDEDGNEVVPDASPDISFTEEDLSSHKPTRKGYTTFQTKDYGRRLPYTRFAVSTNSNRQIQAPTVKKSKRKTKVGDLNGLESGEMEDLLLTQAVEVRRLMRRSIKLHEMKCLGLDGEAMDAEERVTLVELDAKHQDVDGVWAAEFFRDVL